MVDTNIFDAICKGRFDLACLPHRPLFATAIQRSELEAARTLEGRLALLETFQSIDAKRLATSAAIWGISHWGEARYGTDDQNRFVREFATSIQIKDRRVGKRPRDPRNNALRDALIAVTAREHGLVLLTKDRCLSEAADEFKVACKLIE